MIQVRGLSRRFGATAALQSVDFDVQRGEVVGLLGPNGAGKTTCMRILSGYLAPTAGQVRVGDVDVVQDSLAARRQIGYLPEGVPLYPELRVEEYLRFRARLRGVGRKRLSAEVSRVAEACAVADVRGRLLGQLSRGYRQRVGLADALLGCPPLLVLDEPTAGLDPNQIRDVRELIRSAAPKQTVLLSTHILSEVEALCGRVLIIDRGRLVADGAVAEICATHGSEVVLELRGPAEQVEQRLRELVVVHEVSVAPVEGTPEVLRCRLSGRFDSTAMEQLAQAVADEGWTLRALHRDRSQLEDVFARLTAKERRES